MPWNLNPCDSQAISAHGYDPETGTMRIEFRSGGTYDFPGVPQSEYDALVDAPSLGGHFFRHIRPRHAGVKV